MEQPIIGEINFFGKKYKLIAPNIKNLIAENNRQSLSAELDKSIDSFRELLSDIDSIWKKELKHQIKKRVYRNWIVASIRKGLREIRRAKKNISFEKNLHSNKKLLKNVNIAEVSVGFAQRMFDFNKESSIFLQKNIKDHIIPREEIEEGDVLLSYKTSAYLKKHFLAKLIYYAACSKITHIELVSENKNGQIKTLGCRAKTNGVKEMPLRLESREIFFVMKPNIDISQKKELIKKMREFIDLSKQNPSDYKFSEKKCWTACILGLLYTRGISLFSKGLIIPSPIKRAKGYFCSELIEEIFYPLGIYLTPKSNYRGITGPAEIFHSPYLEYKGISCSPESKIDSEKRFDF